MQELRDLEVRERGSLTGGGCVYSALAVGLEVVLPMGACRYSYRCNPTTPGETYFCNTMPFLRREAPNEETSICKLNKSQPGLPLESGGGLSRGNRKYIKAGKCPKALTERADGTRRAC